jgi:hypothetical protein
MTFPAILLGIVLSTIYASAFHFWKGGSWGKLLIYVIISWLGFWIGHLVGSRIGWSFWTIGPINMGMATLGSLIFLFVGEWLSRVEVRKNNSPVPNKKTPPR